MKKIVLFTLFWLLGSNVAYAEIPSAGLGMKVINAGQWPARYLITLTVPQDHHAYLNTGDENIYIPVSFDIDAKLAAAGLVIDKLQKPDGVYDDLVKARVLRDQGDFELELARIAVKPEPLPEKTALTVKYQLCNDLTHVCFRAKTASLDLPLPSVAALPSVDENGGEALSFMDQLLSLFKNNQDNLLILFGLMFIAGLLSVATPCVYPMLPITSMFIVNRAQGQALKEKQHALVYLIGIIGTYTMLGLIAGMTGGAFNSFMQSAWVNLGFAVFFAFFAIALLGYYELGFLQNEVNVLDQHSARVKGLPGTWLMGSVAGLVISPCVGPIVFALLLQVADKIADKSAALALAGQSLGFWDRFGIASEGSLMMAGFGVGVGLPFFIVSVVKFKKLPKAGYWMNKIKYAFGFMILYFAYVYLDKGMGVLGVASATTLSLAIGILVVWLAVVHFNVIALLPMDAQPNQKMHRFCGLMTLIIGCWLVVGSLGKIPFMMNAQANVAAESIAQECATNGTASSMVQEEAGIAWYRSYAAAQQRAKETGKPIFIDFYASWCANCIAFKAETAKNKILNQALREHAIAVKLIDKEPEFEKFRELPEHRQLKIGLPYFAILSPDGKLAWSTTDYMATEKMVSVLVHWAS